MDFDAAEVLAYLRSLGYHDIEPDQFRLFLKDLRKLIRSEEHKRLETEEKWIRNSEALSYSSTVSFDAKKQSPKSAPHPIVKINITDRNTANRKVLKPQMPPNTTKTIISARPSTRKSNVIKPTKRPELLKKSDPVALYHFYETIWKRTKIPGESDHSALRWEIRERLSNDNYYEATTATTAPLSTETTKNVKKSAILKTARTIASVTKQQQLEHERFW